MLIRGALLADGSRTDIRLSGGFIAELAPAGTLGPLSSEKVLELAGYVLLPALADPHAHLDKAFTADHVPNSAGDLEGAISAWANFRRHLSRIDIAERAHRAVLLALSHGVTAIRTHIDVGAGIHLRGLEAMLGIRDKFRHLLDLQVVPMTYPLTGNAGAANLRMLREALTMGADLVGGAPHLDPDPRTHLHLCLDLAEEFGRGVDLHLDEHLRAGSCDLIELVQLAAAGFPQPVTASHCVSLSMRSPREQARISATVARAEVAVLTMPATNLYLQARDRPTATPRGLTAIASLLRAGANLAAGGDNVQDPFNPLGHFDPLQTAQLLVLAGHLDCQLAYRMVSESARKVMGLPPIRVEVGAPADLVAVAGSSAREALASVSEDRVVFRRGQVVVRTRVLREWHPGVIT